MNITRIYIDGFKNVIDTDLTLNKINGILSVNNYGKSNLLEGIKFGLDFILLSEIKKDLLMHQQSYMPLIDANYLKDFKFEIEFEEYLNDEMYTIIYGYSFNWFNDNNKNKINNEYLKIKKTFSTQKFSLFMERNGNNVLFKQSLTGRCDKSSTINNHDLFINTMSYMNNLYYINLIKSLVNISIYINKDNSNDNMFTNDFNFTSIYNQNLFDLTRAIQYINSNYKNKFEFLKDIFLNLFPEFSDLKIEEYNISDDSIFNSINSEYSLLIKIKHINKYVNYRMISDGSKRVLTLLTIILLADINNIPIVCIEEIENSIHPRLVENILEVLEQISANIKFIFTSHSPLFASFLKLDEIYIGVPNHNSIATFSKIKPSYFNRIKANAQMMEMDTGLYLFDLMCAYDESDSNILKKFLVHE